MYLSFSPEYPMNSVAQGGGFGGGNFGNMGVNGVGGCHNGHDGMGWNAGWDGQNNVGFNPGMEGTRNGGYYSAASAGGYNHQSHGNLQMPTQQYQNHHFLRQQPYPRGGRGGFVGGARQYSHERQQQQAFQDSQFSQQLQGIDEAVAAVVGSSGDEKKGEKIPSVVSGDPENITDPNDVPTDTASTVLAGADPTTEDLADSLNPAAPVNPDMAQYFPPDDFRGPGYQPQFYPLRGGPRGNFRAGYRGDFGMGPRGGGVHNIAPIPSMLGDAESDKIPSVGLGVEGAPTGPKALREGVPPVRGVPIRGGAFGRGRGVYAGSSWTRRFVGFYYFPANNLKGILIISCGLVPRLVVPAQDPDADLAPPAVIEAGIQAVTATENRDLGTEKVDTASSALRVWDLSPVDGLQNVTVKNRFHPPKTRSSPTWLQVSQTTQILLS